MQPDPVGPMNPSTSLRDVADMAAALLSQYDVAVPTYGHYPSRRDWTGVFTCDAWSQQLSTLHGSTAPLALHVHLPFCDSGCLSCGGLATLTSRVERVDQYLDRLEHEINIVGGAIGDRPCVHEMHWGGGTPNLLDDEQLARLADMLQHAFDIDAQTKCSIDADPRLATPAQLNTLVSLGFRRICFGVQDLDPAARLATGRVHQPEQPLRDAVAQARIAGFDCVELELLFGLPGQGAESFARSLTTVVELAADRVACHGAARVPWLRAHLKRTDDLTLQLGRERFGMFRDAVCLLAASGYAWIGADHFVRADDALVLAADDGRLSRTGMGYTMRAGTNMLGLGTGAMSELNGWCVQNTADPVAWQRAVGARQLPLEQGHVRSPDDTDRAAAITHLLCNAELPYDLFLGDMYELVDRFEEFAADGLVEFQSERVVVTPLGRFFLRALCGTLDAYRVALDLPVRYSHAV